MSGRREFLAGLAGVSVAAGAVVAAVASPDPDADRPPIVPGRGPNAHLPGADRNDESTIDGMKLQDIMLPLQAGVAAALALVDVVEKMIDDEGVMPRTEVAAVRWALKHLDDHIQGGIDRGSDMALAGRQNKGVAHV